MKEVQKEIKSYKTVYEAIDGTEFISKEECEKYEHSAKCVLNNKYQKLVIKTDTEWNLFYIGSEDEQVDVVKIKDSSDVNTVLTMIAFYNPSSAKNLEWLQKREKRLINSLNNGLVFIGRGYEGDSFYITTTSIELSDKLKLIIDETN